MRKLREQLRRLEAENARLKAELATAVDAAFTRGFARGFVLGEDADAVKTPEPEG